MVVVEIMVLGMIATSVMEMDMDMVRIMDYGKDDEDGGIVKW